MAADAGTRAASSSCSPWTDGRPARQRRLGGVDHEPRGVRRGRRRGAPLPARRRRVRRDGRRLAGRRGPTLAELVGPGPRGRAVPRARRCEAPDGWSVPFGGQGHQMVLTAALAPPPAADIVELGASDAPEMRALVKLTEPGPFAAAHPRARRVRRHPRPRRRPPAGDGRPAHQRPRLHRDQRGVHAPRRPPARLRRGRDRGGGPRLLDEGITPFLHVAVDNHNARRVYERIGFTTRRIAHFVGVRTPSALS